MTDDELKIVLQDTDYHARRIAKIFHVPVKEIQQDLIGWMIIHDDYYDPSKSKRRTWLASLANWGAKTIATNMYYHRRKHVSLDDYKDSLSINYNFNEIITNENIAKTINQMKQPAKAIAIAIASGEPLVNIQQYYDMNIFQLLDTVRTEYINVWKSNNLNNN